MRVVLAEDLTLLRDGLIRLLDPRTTWRSSEAVGRRAGAVHALITDQPDVAVVDVRLPPTFTDEGLRRRSRPAARCRACRCWSCPSTSNSSTPANCSPVAAAASATCSRTGSSTSGEFVEASRRVAAAARRWTPRSSPSCWPAAPGRAARGLTPREREVLALMAEGRSNAGDRGPAGRHREGRRKHIDNIFTKLDLYRRRRRQSPGARRSHLPEHLRRPALPLTVPPGPGGCDRRGCCSACTFVPRCRAAAACQEVMAYDRESHDLRLDGAPIWSLSRLYFWADRAALRGCRRLRPGIGAVMVEATASTVVGDVFWSDAPGLELVVGRSDEHGDAGPGGSSAEHVPTTRSKPIHLGL